MSAILEVKDLHVRYGDYEAVKGVSFSLERGGILGIVGESGSGKSTIAKVLMGLHSEWSGDIRLNTAVHLQLSPSPAKTRRVASLSMIFQDAVGSLNPRMTVRQTLAEVLAHVRRGDRIVAPTKHEQRATSQEPRSTSPLSLLEQVGLSAAVLDQYPRELSGGQCQRVSVARALATNPEILIADEPVSALDVSVQARVLNLLRDLRRELGLSILLIAHDLAVVKNVCDSICVMERGVFVDVGPSETVFNNPQSEYTHRLLSAVPKL